MTEFRLNAYHIMWLFVFFDLPVATKREQKAASDFRKNLLKDGFVMMQFSVYVRHCASYESLTVHKKRVKAIMPVTGKISMLAVTDKQYSEIETIFGKTAKKRLELPFNWNFFNILR